MRKILALIMVSILILGVVGCTSDNTTIDKGELSNTNTETGLEKYHDLSADSPFEITDTIEKDKVYIVDMPLYTNSTEITIQNQTDVAVTVYLYNENDMEEPILQMVMDGKDKEAFKNLTSRFVYYIGVLADEPMQLDMVVSD